MTRRIYLFRFSSEIEFSEVNKILYMAMAAVTGMIGGPGLRAETIYSTDEEHNTCMIYAPSEAGINLANCFLGLLLFEFDEGDFCMERFVPCNPDSGNRKKEKRA